MQRAQAAMHSVAHDAFGAAPRMRRSRTSDSSRQSTCSVLGGRICTRERHGRRALVALASQLAKAMQSLSFAQTLSRSACSWVASACCTTTAPSRSKGPWLLRSRHIGLVAWPSHLSSRRTCLYEGSLTLRCEARLPCARVTCDGGRASLAFGAVIRTAPPSQTGQGGATGRA